MKYMPKGILSMFIALSLGLILTIGITYMFYAYGETTKGEEATPEYKPEDEAWEAFTEKGTKNGF